jgi:hypothetical protein
MKQNNHILAKNHKFDPWPLDEIPRPKVTNQG